MKRLKRVLLLFAALMLWTAPGFAQLVQYTNSAEASAWGNAGTNARTPNPA
jgi:hypothetical protein